MTLETTTLMSTLRKSGRRSARGRTQKRQRTDADASADRSNMLGAETKAKHAEILLVQQPVVSESLPPSMEVWYRLHKMTAKLWASWAAATPGLTPETTPMASLRTMPTTDQFHAACSFFTSKPESVQRPTSIGDNKGARRFFHGNVISDAPT